MSAFGLPTSLLANFTGLVTITPKRSIGPIVADATVAEQHDDQLTITEHPVEQGAAITDHAFKQPARIRIIAGFSNSSPNAGFSADYVNQIYQQLLQLQADRELLDVYTARRNYQDMLIEGLSLTTDQDTENSMIISVSLRQLILVQTQTVDVPPNDVQKSPQKTGSVQDTGVKQATPVTNPPAGIS